MLFVANTLYEKCYQETLEKCWKNTHKQDEEISDEIIVTQETAGVSAHSELQDLV